MSHNLIVRYSDSTAVYAISMQDVCEEYMKKYDTDSGKKEVRFGKAAAKKVFKSMLLHYTGNMDDVRQYLYEHNKQLFDLFCDVEASLK